MGFSPHRFDKHVYEQVGKFKRIAHVEDDNTFVLATEHDLEEMIEENKRLRENQTGKEMMRLAARVPPHVAEKAFREGWFHDDDAWKKWLNDPENRDFRVWEGRA